MRKYLSILWNEDGMIDIRGGDLKHKGPGEIPGLIDFLSVEWHYRKINIFIVFM